MVTPSRLWPLTGSSASGRDAMATVTVDAREAALIKLFDAKCERHLLRTLELWDCGGDNQIAIPSRNARSYRPISLADPNNTPRAAGDCVCANAGNAQNTAPSKTLPSSPAAGDATLPPHDHREKKTALRSMLRGRPIRSSGGVSSIRTPLETAKHNTIPFLLVHEILRPLLFVLGPAGAR